MKNPPLITFENNEFTVQHELIDIQQAFAVNLTPRNDIQVRLGTVGNKFFRVRFYDSYGNRIRDVYPDSTNLKFYFNRGVFVQSKSLKGKVGIRRDNLELNPNNLYSTSANLWIYGIMEGEKKL